MRRPGAQVAVPATSRRNPAAGTAKAGIGNWLVTLEFSRRAHRAAAPSRCACRPLGERVLLELAKTARTLARSAVDAKKFSEVKLTGSLAAGSQFIGLAHDLQSKVADCLAAAGQPSRYHYLQDSQYV